MQRFSRNSDCVSPGTASKYSRPLRCRAGAPRGPLGLAAALAAASRSAAAPSCRRLALMPCTRPLWSSARSLPLWRRSPSRSTHGATVFGAALALLANAWSCRRARGGVTLGRRSSAEAAHSLSAIRSDRRLVLSACGRRPSRFLSGGGRHRAELTAPLPAAPRRRSWCRLSRAAALTAA